MAITRSSSTRSSSPTPSEDSDLYYADFRGDTPSPAPSQVADTNGWGPGDTPVPSDSRDVTPTPPTARTPSATPVAELTAQDFPALPAPAPVAKPRVKALKARKGKDKEKAKPAEPTIVEDSAHADANDDDDPFLTADIARATAASLGLQAGRGTDDPGASSSRRPAAAPGSPSKRQRANTAGDSTATSPAPAAAAGVTAPAPAPVPAADTPVQAQLPSPRQLSPSDPAPGASALNVPPAESSAVEAEPMSTNAAGAAATYAAITAAPGPAIARRAPEAPAGGRLIEYVTADGNPPRGVFTHIPLDFIQIYLNYSLLFAPVSEVVRTFANMVEGGKAWLAPIGGNGRRFTTHRLLVNLIADALNIDPSTVTIGIPAGVGRRVLRRSWELGVVLAKKGMMTNYDM
ncbi:hypothetical protein GGX14DRAFT_395242 [Mycena pura]|uniref:Uncharacterized protein n=1 Tax=Mycena pura TaxID=153505 RepID=A0AAD6VCI1_9AGAR|nr:hypothetical protein GGX14DRAFT_395242 [Mycena pura]